MDVRTRTRRTPRGDDRSAALAPQGGRTPPGSAPPEPVWAACQRVIGRAEGTLNVKVPAVARMRVAGACAKRNGTAFPSRHASRSQVLPRGRKRLNVTS